jgi:hypothetical protein
LLTAWILFPVLSIALCLGCGLLLEAAAGRRLPGLLLAPAGFGVVVVVAGVATAGDATAQLATPAVLALAVAGAGLTYPWRGRRPERWAVAAALAVFAVYAAPVVLSGNPTFDGYIKLDDTATWLAFVDRLMEHGRDLSGLPHSSYETTLAVNLPSGYPVGAFLPLGSGAQLTGEDPAWLVQPYMATMAALLALCLAWIARSLVESAPLRALAAFGAAQPALLFGYSLWGGIKEVAVALAIATLAAVAPFAAERGAGWRMALPAALLTTALLAMVGSGGLVWILPILGLVALALWRASGVRALLERALPLAVALLVLGIPVVFAAGAFSPTQGGLTSAAELGNLIEPLSVAQYFGIWPNGDFRLDPGNGALTAFLIAMAILAALAGTWFAWIRRAWEPLLYLVGATAGSLAVFLYASPWVGAKALASAGPAFLLLALAGAATFAVRVERVLGLTVFAAVLAGVLWSNALAYHDVSLAPYDQLTELERIGDETGGQGPTLMTEYQPYGVRHFLRDADAEGVSELRYRPIALRGGGEAEKGAWADTDQVELAPLLVYRTLVLRRSPAQSRPPSAYALRDRGPYYDVWQRPPGAESAAILEHLPLGDFQDPAAVPSCVEVQRLAGLAGPAGSLATVERGPTVVASLSDSTHPVDWIPTEAESPDLVPTGPGEATLRLEVPSAGRYGVYLQGSVRNRLTVGIDGEPVGSVAEQLNPASQFLHFGEVELSPGSHAVSVKYDGQSLAPGSGGPPSPIGPLVLSPDDGEPPVRLVPASRARTLCGRRLDWIEAIVPRFAG